MQWQCLTACTRRFPAVALATAAGWAADGLKPDMDATRCARATATSASTAARQLVMRPVYVIHIPASVSATTPQTKPLQKHHHEATSATAAE